MTGTGIDGCRGGWCCICLSQSSSDKPICFVAPSFDALWKELPQARYRDNPVLVDMPIGLPSAAYPVRECDVQARTLLGKRRSTVFSPPCREALSASNHAMANSVNKSVTGRGLSIQAWGIAKRIRELDIFLQEHPGLADAVWEAHPELCFAKLAGAPLPESKRSKEGRMRRLCLLEEEIPGATAMLDYACKKYPRSVVQPDDILDAMVLAVCASKGMGGVERLGSAILDETGLPMRIALPG